MNATAAVKDVPDVRLAYAKQACYFVLAHCAIKGVYFGHVFVAQLFSASQATIKHIFGRRSPTQMALGATTQMAVPTRVRGLVYRGRRGTVNTLTNDAGDQSYLAIHADVAVAVDTRIWPLQAVVTLVGEDDIIEVAQGVSPSRTSTSERITVRDPPRPVRVTPTARVMLLAAIRNRAYSGSSHFSLLSGCFGQSPSRW